MADTLAARALKMIQSCTDVENLRKIAKNARRNNELDVARAADLRLYEVSPAEEPGSLEHDVWRSVYALEDTLTQERGRTTRLGRTRPKIAKVGEVETLTSLILSAKPSEGFSMLIERAMTDLTFEAVALRHPDRFNEQVLLAASERLRLVEQS